MITLSRRGFRPRPLALVLLVVALTSSPLPAQQAAAPAGAGADALPRSFRELSLGMSLDELRAALTADELFNFRGERDVSFLPRRTESLVETTGLSFIRRAFFQLYEDRVFIMAFSLDASLVDHYSVYTALVRKYGEPATLNPREAVWEAEGIRVAVERPLTVKYIDMAVFNRLVAESEAAESAELLLRQEFLNDF
jgi:hypothetical protein